MQDELNDEFSLGKDLPENCQPKPFDSFDYELVECVFGVSKCKHALRFGYGYLCRHPRRIDVIQYFQKLKLSNANPTGY